MKKYVTRAVAKKLMLGGITLAMVGVVCNIFLLLRVYGKAGDCFNEATDNAASCTLTTEQIAAHVVTYSIYFGLALAVAGKIALIYLKPKK